MHLTTMLDANKHNLMASGLIHPSLESDDSLVSVRGLSIPGKTTFHVAFSEINFLTLTQKLDGDEGAVTGAVAPGFQ